MFKKATNEHHLRKSILIDAKLQKILLTKPNNPFIMITKALHFVMVWKDMILLPLKLF